MKIKKNIKDSTIKTIFALMVGFINGFFGGGGGLICVPTLEKVYKLPTKNSHATAIAVMLPLSVASSIIYMFNNNFNVLNCASVSLGVILGGVIGAIFLKRFNSNIIRWIFIVVLFSAGVRMIV